MRVLAACEYSGKVREAFRARGHDAWSCDFLESEDESLFHIRGDVIPVLAQDWDIVIAFPPCTNLCVSGARWFPAKLADGSQAKSIEFFRIFTRLKCKWAIENPVGIMSNQYRKPDQIIQPWHFGSAETKATCLWLNKLPQLQWTHSNHGDFFTDQAPKDRIARIHLMPPSPDRWKERSRTFDGIANAMASQWG